VNYIHSTMRVYHKWQNHSVLFTVECDVDELPARFLTNRSYCTMTRSRSVTGESTFRFLLPDCIVNFDGVHPDLWALVILLVVSPFIKDELRLSFSISSSFALAFNESTGKRIVPVESTIQPRMHHRKYESDADRRMFCGAAFSGRVHSYAVAAIMGQSTRLVALDHWNAPTLLRSSPYPSDGLYYSLDTMESKGFHVSMVKTDVASLCEPYGFPHPLTPACGPVMLADALDLHSVALGSRLYDVRALGDDEGVLSTIGFKAMDLPVQNRYVDEDTKTLQPTQEGTLESWRNLFSACGLSLELPTCGLHDALLVKLLAEHKLWHEIHYCLYARPDFRCNNCIECHYYNGLYEAVTTKTDAFSDLLKQSQIRYPETLTCLNDMKCAHRWHLFWAMIASHSKDQTYPQLVRMSQVLMSNFVRLHSGTKTLVDDEAWPNVERGLQRLMSVLSRRIHRR
jgi:hypothetical protein